LLQEISLDKDHLRAIIEMDTTMLAVAKAQALEAINAAPENAVFSRTVAENGNVAIQWLDSSDPNKTYTLGADDNALNFSTTQSILPPVLKKPTLSQKFLKAYGNKMPTPWRTYLTELSKKPEPEWSKNLKKFSTDLQKKVNAFSKKAPTKKR